MLDASARMSPTMAIRMPCRRSNQSANGQKVHRTAFVKRANASPSASHDVPRYEPRQPDRSVPYQVVRKPFEISREQAGLTPRPRINLVVYHGVLAPRAARRALVVRFDPAAHPGPESAVPRDPDAAGTSAD